MSDPRPWAARARPYARPIWWRSLAQLLGNGASLAALYAVMWQSADRCYAVTLLLALPTGGFLLRLFMIQHDCGHGSFFASRRANDWVGRVIGVLTLTPYFYWSRAHAVHHATSGNLDRRGIGDIDTLTAAEYRRRGPLARARYRLYRHPLVLLGLGPAYQIFLRQRVPFRLPEPRRACAVSILGTDLALAALFAAAGLSVGLERFLWVWVPPLVPMAWAGLWLFFVQHQIENAYWVSSRSWSFESAALEGSSFYDLPRPLRFFTSNIGYHHAHHLCSRIPNYRLREFTRDQRDLPALNRLTLRGSLRCARLALWDDRRGRMIGFRELEASATAAR